MSDETDDQTDHEDLDFEDALQRLQTIVDELEGGDLGLEEAMEAFEEGNELAAVCQQRLDEAEGKLEELLDSGDSVDFDRPDDGS